MAKKIPLPSNVEAERLVLGSLLLFPESADTVFTALVDEDFSDVDPRNKIIFHALRELYDQKIPLQMDTLCNQLVNTQLEAASGGNDYRVELIMLDVDPTRTDRYIEMVNEQSLLRQLLLKMREIESNYASGVPNVGEFIQKSNDQIATICQQRTVQGMRSSGEVAASVRSELDEKMKRGGDKVVTGVRTGYRKFDEMTHGWQNGDLIILAARPSVGKTALGMNFAYQTALKEKKTVGFFSLEMSANKVMERLIACAGTVSNDRIQSGFLNSNERVKVSHALQDIAATKIYFDDTPNCLLGDLLAKANKLKRTNPDLCLLVIDYLGRITYSKQTNLEAHQQEVSMISGALKSLARTLNVPIICLSQLNRNVENNEDNKPSLANLRDSGAIEQDADIVMLMWRKDYAGSSIKRSKFRKDGQQEEAPKKPEMSAEEREKTGDISEVEINIAKNRNGKTGEVTLLFQKSFSKFTEPSTSFEESQAAYASSTGFEDE